MGILKDKGIVNSNTKSAAVFERLFGDETFLDVGTLKAFGIHRKVLD